MAANVLKYDYRQQTDSETRDEIMPHNSDVILDRQHQPTPKETPPNSARSPDHAEPAPKRRRDRLSPHLAAACIYTNAGDTAAQAAAAAKRIRDYIDVDAGEIL
jgi:hypothetical protein